MEQTKANSKNSQSDRKTAAQAPKSCAACGSHSDSDSNVKGGKTPPKNCSK